MDWIIGSFLIVLLLFIVAILFADKINESRNKTKDTLFFCENGISGLKLSTKVKHGERFRRINSKGQGIPPEDTDYWTDEDFDRFNGETPYGNILDIVTPKIKKRFPDMNLSDDEMKKLIAVIFSESKNLFIKKIKGLFDAGKIKMK
jgi:hypothetical protein